MKDAPGEQTASTVNAAPVMQLRAFVEETQLEFMLLAFIIVSFIVLF